MQELIKKLSATLTVYEREQMLPLIEEILHLKKEKNAVILGHNYMRPEVYHGVSDFVGDSLYLARQAAATDAKIILFNGVHFMAETASILNPDRLVLIADPQAGCSLAESINEADAVELKMRYPSLPFVSYINCSAAIKAQSDICCTSANALQVIESLNSERVIFVPDMYLARNVQEHTKKEIIAWEKGACMVHEQYEVDDIEALRKQFDMLTVIAHPECPPEIIQSSDFSGSTSQMSSFIEKSKAENIFLITECSMADNLRTDFPERNFVSTCHTCPHMKRITLEGVRDALLYERFEVRVEDRFLRPARRALERMLTLQN